MSMFKRGLNTELPKSYIETPNAVPRFWLPAGKKKEIIFLTNASEAVIASEYKVKVGGKIVYATCLADFGKPDPLAELYREINNTMVISKYGAAFMTVIDIEGYADRNQVAHKNIKSLFVAKGGPKSLLQALSEDLAEDGKSLRGAKVRVTRGAAKTSAAVGDSFNFRSMVDLASLEGVTADELDYETILAPNEAWCEDLANRLRLEYSISTGNSAASAEREVSY